MSRSDTSFSKGPRVAFKTFGCRSNFSDTMDLVSLTREQGGNPVDFCLSEKSDVIVLNTCTVTDSADKEAFRLLEKIHLNHPSAKVIVTGCLAETSSDKLKDKFPDVLVIGPGQKKSVIEAIISDVQQEFQNPKKADNDSNRTHLSRIRKPQHHSVSLHDTISNTIVGPGQYIGDIRVRSRYHLRVQEGCENHCTFCIIPKTRGHLVSKEDALVLEDIKKLIFLGYKEIVLTGTHLGGYGEDSGSSLLELLKKIDACIQGLKNSSVLNPEFLMTRIRLSSLDPDDLSRELVDFIAKSHTFCPHLHICMQAFTDSVLKRMNRKYRINDAKELLCYIKDVFPGCSIGSDIITGFPGESRVDFEKGIDEFNNLPISYLHVFPYSERTGTAATRLDGIIGIGERKRRAARWRSIAERRQLEWMESLLGKTLDVVLEAGGESVGHYRGTSGEFADVGIVVQDLYSSDKKSDYLGLENRERAVFRAGELVRARAFFLDKKEGRLLCELSDQEKLAQFQGHQE
ncbi:MAG TPA: radical SAM protein [Oligoflexia bacterium]|nr:radical SAM protein [Oligoflexia bacterium]HMP49169.1 radical SAM protein [Oligoflexia bacterium]